MSFEVLCGLIRKRPRYVQPKPTFKYRFKDEFYDKLAIATLGESLYEQMKNGKLQWGKLEDEQFIMAEFLQEYLEKYEYKEQDIDQEQEKVKQEEVEQEEVKVEEEDEKRSSNKNR